MSLEVRKQEQETIYQPLVPLGGDLLKQEKLGNKTIKLIVAL